ncbi:MAG: rod shape-determining protein MreC [Cytophagales bacterium]|nr:rod shape-determining protein MreC [Cytophagales bacterium]
MAFSSRGRYSTFKDAQIPLFRQGVSALSRLIFFCALALFLMVADVRYSVTKPIRTGIATLLFPIQWVVMQPLAGVQELGQYFQNLEAAQSDTKTVHARLTQMMQKSVIVDQLQMENQRLRQLLDLKQKPETSGIAAEVLFDAADPHSRKVIVNKGSVNDILLGSPVLDELGVVGQVTRVFPLTSEVTLLIDQRQAIPVLNTRTGARSVAYGDAASYGEMLDLRFMGTNADVLTGDLLTTSGVDGIYPAGLPVAKIDKIERRADTAFAKIQCIPIAKMTGTLHVMILKPLTTVQTSGLDLTPSAVNAPASKGRSP